MAATLGLEDRWQLFERMLLIRRFEEGLLDLAGKFQFGHYHLYIGQEATGVAAINLLDTKDCITTTHRNHGHVLARGLDPGPAYAEILGRATGVVGGRGGTIHLCEPALGFLSTSGVVGGAISLGVGGAFACKQQKQGAIAMAFFGDGALEEGVTFESLNLAALWKLPVVFMCENNSAEALGRARGGYPTLIHAASELCAIPQSLGIPSVRIDGADVDAVHWAVSEALDDCRAGKGPRFIEAATPRWAGSAALWPALATGVTDLGMASGAIAIPDEHRAWFDKQDPVLRLARTLLGADANAKHRLATLDNEVGRRINAAKQFAIDSPLPPAQAALEHVFA